jgi:hypothetical protein
MRIRILLLLGTLLASGVVWADDSATTGLTGTVKVMDAHPSVRMVSEAVHIKLPDAVVRAEFVFRNEGPATTVRMAFPEEGGGDTSAPKKLTSHFSYFRSYVDGKRFRVTKVVDEKHTGEGQYHVWWTKTVKFAKHQTRRVVCEYKGGGSDSTGGSRGFGYTLVTGASWKGPIGRAVITCDVSGLNDYSRIHFGPKGYKRHGNIVTWDLRNFEPKEDIHVGWFDGFIDVFVNGRSITAVREKGKLVDRHSWNFEWRYPFPQRMGREVYGPLEAYAAWLGAKASVVKSTPLPGTQGLTKDTRVPVAVRIARAGRWIELRKGSKVARTSQGIAKLPRAPTIYKDGGPMIASFTPIVRALGGRARFDAKAKKMIVKMP